MLLIGTPALIRAQSKGKGYPKPGKIVIHRDKYGIPSIVAANENDGVYALGYVTAKDAPKEVLGFYKRGRGRYAEIAGKGALLQDLLMRALGFEERAQAAVLRLPPDLAETLNAYCAGFNRALEEQKETLPKWVEPITLVDLLSFAQMINAIFPLLELQGELTPGTGSNQFVVAPKRSASGHPILSADPHLDLGGLFLWHEYALYTPEYQFRGVTFPGAPFGVMGHTNRVAWSMTNNDPDLYDFYKVQLRPGNSKQYNYHGEWREIDNASFEMRYRENGELKTQKQTMPRTAWGPIIPFRGMAVRLSVPDPIATMRHGLGMQRAKNVAEFRSNMRNQGLTMWNFVFADVEGHTAYQYNAYVPRRNPQFDWTKPIAGADPRTTWGLPLSLDELPHTEDPASGILVNCNSAPWLTPLGNEIASTGWAKYVTTYEHTTRYDLLSALLAKEEPITPEIAKRYATDTEIPHAKTIIEALNRAYNEVAPALRTPVLKEALDVLNRWNKRSDVDSKGLVFYRYWRTSAPEVAKLTKEAKQGGLWTRDKQEQALRSLQVAAEVQKRRFQTLETPWGEFHRLKRGNKEAPSIGYNFPDETAVVPNSGALNNAEKRILCNFGSSFRMITHLKPDGVESWSILPFGNLQDPQSPHYNDQMEMYGRGEYKPTRFGLANAKRYALSTTLLNRDGTPITHLLLQGGTLVDGTGKPRRKADMRLENGKIGAIGNLSPRENENVWNVEGLVIAPGFLDAHSHADGGLLEEPTAETQIRQGITTAIVGQDGGSHLPLKEWFGSLEQRGIALNVASFIGQGSLRSKVIGQENRPATSAEIALMQSIVQQEMEAGAVGLSTGLEYVPGRYASTEEIIACAKATTARKGIYISHLRNEDNGFFEAFQELVRIAKEASLPAQVSHIKLGSSKVWGKAGEVLKRMETLRKEGVAITADVYPYTYWQSTIRVLIATEEFENRALWEQGLKDIGGAQNVRLGLCTFRKAWEGKTLAEIAQAEQRDPVSIAQEIVRRTGRASGEREGVIVTAMQESDLRAFIQDPYTMFCSDGGLRGSHPRGAGTYPRLLGVYALREKVISLEEMVRKMTSLVADRMGLKGRGRLVVGSPADVVLFDPATVQDTATVQAPQSAPEGILSVFVNGIAVLERGQLTGALPGKPLRSTR